MYNQYYKKLLNDIIEINNISNSDKYKINILIPKITLNFYEYYDNIYISHRDIFLYTSNIGFNSIILKDYICIKKCNYIYYCNNKYYKTNIKKLLNIQNLDYYCNIKFYDLF